MAENKFKKTKAAHLTAVTLIIAVTFIAVTLIAVTLKFRKCERGLRSLNIIVFLFFVRVLFLNIN